MGSDTLAVDQRSIAAVIALKPVKLAKTRLSSTSAELRSRLALAMAFDVISALSVTISRIIVVSNEPHLESQLRRVGLAAHVVADPPPPGSTSGLASGLNHGLAHGAAIADSDITVAAVADLPCLRSADVASVLETATTGLDGTGPPGFAQTPGRWFCPDLSGTGTTLLVARHTRLRPLFEGASAIRHRQSGALELVLGETARRDVDTAADLREASALTLGQHTAELLTEFSLDDFFAG